MDIYRYATYSNENHDYVFWNPRAREFGHNQTVVKGMAKLRGREKKKTCKYYMAYNTYMPVYLDCHFYIFPCL